MLPKVVMGQVASVLFDKEKNLRTIEDVVRKSQPDLAVFGELFLTGYMVKDSLARLSEPIDGPSVRKLKKIAREYGTDIITGFPEKCPKRRGLIYNSALVVTQKGAAGTYRKMHLANFGPFEEKQYFGTGDEFPVFKTSAGKIGLIVCYDIFFPELSKAYALKGADMIACISASPSYTRPFFEKVLVARAIENTAFALYCNLVGTELNMVFWGGCQAVGPRGDLLVRGKYYKDEIVAFDMDLRELGVARGLRPTLRNTRKDVIDELRDSV